MNVSPTQLRQKWPKSESKKMKCQKKTQSQLRSAQYIETQFFPTSWPVTKMLGRNPPLPESRKSNFFYRNAHLFLLHNQL